MNKSPFLNAASAALYIIAIVFVMNGLISLTAGKNTILIPMVILGLFVLSTAVMGFLFALEPLSLYLENHKREALVFFAKTVGIFACFVALFIAALLSALIL